MRNRSVLASVIVTFAALAAIDRVGPGEMVQDVVAIPSSLCGLAQDGLAAVGWCSPRELPPESSSGGVEPSTLTTVNVELSLEGNKLGSIHLAVDKNGRVLQKSVEAHGDNEIYFSDL